MVGSSGSYNNHRISSMTGSCEVEMDAGKINFVFDLKSDNDGISCLGSEEWRW